MRLGGTAYETQSPSIPLTSTMPVRKIIPEEKTQLQKEIYIVA
jgi:hypothetical protein